MKQERYELESAQSLTVFEFVSVGRKGKIHKIIQFSLTNLKDFYNLGFGDKDEQTGEIDDLSISNNGDTKKNISNGCIQRNCLYRQTPRSVGVCNRQHSVKNTTLSNWNYKPIN